MERYISILRGINVSGKNLLKMAALRASFKNMGFDHITTYIQSGNIIFSAIKSSIKNLEQTISQQIKTDFGFEIPVIVIPIDVLEKVVAGNPFLKDSKKELAFMHVTFLGSAPEIVNLNEIEEKKQSGEAIAYANNVLYLYCPLGYGNTKLNTNFLEKKLKVHATTRNWKTTNDLLKIARAPGEEK